MPGNFTETVGIKLRALLGTSKISDVDEGFLRLAEDCAAKLLGYSSGTHAARPAAGVANRVYRETDTSRGLCHDTGSAWEVVFQPGDLKLSAAPSAPEGWLACEGQAISRATYADLFAVIGTGFGEGDKSTTFNVPDYRERTPVGAGGALARGAIGGEATHVLTTGEMPSHTHVQNFAGQGVIKVQENGAGPSVSNATSTTTGATGGGGAHNNREPYTVCNVFIKT